MLGFEVEPHIYQRLEDYCNTGPKGTGRGYVYTSGIITADEELLWHELGEQAWFWLIQEAVDGWNPLMQLMVEELERGTGH